MLPSGLPDLVDDAENLARFLTQSSQYNKIMVKPAAFLPSTTTGRETSVSRHGAEPVDALRALGLIAAGVRTLHGAAIVSAAVVRSVGLDVLADEGPKRHAVIRGWPWGESDPDEDKARRKKMAIEIARAADLVILD